MSLPTETILTYENLYADFEAARDSKDFDKAREIIKAMQEYSGDEALRMEREIDEMDV